MGDDSALALYRAARAADPSFFRAQFEYNMMMLARFRGPELRRELMAGDTSSAYSACLLAAARAVPYDERSFEQLQALEARSGPSACTDAFLVAMEGGFTQARADRAMRDTPGLLEVIGAVAMQLNASGEWKAADEMLIAAIASADNPLVALSLLRTRTYWAMARGDTARAFALERRLAEYVSRDRRPGILAAFLAARCDNAHTIPGATKESRDRSCREFFAIVRTHRAWFTEWVTTRRVGKLPLDRGELSAAAPVLTRSVQLADSLGVPGLQLDSYTLRGRYYLKSGQLSLALRDLRRATTVGPAAELSYYLAEAYHNLAHVQEGAGRLAEAAAMADSFAAIAATLPGTSLRWSSKRDAGTIRWSAGWHAAAARDFDAMVRIIDELGNDGHSFAGEYFERIGDLGRALKYYRIGARLPNPDLRNFAALARLYEAIGLPDSAEAAARSHDASTDRWPITEQPLLPDVLVRQGRLPEAIALSAAWASRQKGNGNIEGAVIAHLRLAELYLSNREPKQALVAAMRADSLRRLLRLTTHQVEAKTLEGRALFDDGRRSAGVAALQQAVRLAAARPSMEATLSSNLALGDALALLGRRVEALSAYDGAATAIERMTAGLDADIHRAGFKARHLAPFDGALRVLINAVASTANADAALQWSARRKAAALNLTGSPGGAMPRLPPTAALRNRLGADEALIDFTVLDSTVMAVVLRRASAKVIRLAVPATRLKAWVDGLRRPLVAAPGGSIDLAHAPFDAAAAESLYTALVRPLEPMLSGVGRLAIVSDDALWYVPFPALVTGVVADSTRARRRASYLVERYEMRLLPSAAFLGQSGARLPHGFQVAAFAYDVPGGTSEVAALRTTLGTGRIVVRNGAGATERNALAASADVLHLAVHGVVNDRDPLSSHLRLAREGNDDGLLHMAEVASTRVAARLVVLTACEAVSGKLYAGEGLLGIARAFLLAGARDVVASAWPVGASAADLTEAFYGELVRGRTPSAALRSAQLSLLNTPRTAHPLHWAGFVVFDAGRF